MPVSKGLKDTHFTEEETETGEVKKRDGVG